MAYQGEMVGILSDTEQKLRQLIVQAMEAGDPSSIRTIQAAVVSLRQLRVKLAAPAGAVEAETNSDDGARRSYPQFYMQDGHLIRIGWSRKHQKRYVCRVPQDVFAATIRAMRILAARCSGRAVKIEQIIQQVVMANGDKIPRRGVYLALGMLQEQGKIRQDHAGAYRIPPDIGAIALSGFRQAV